MRILLTLILATASITANARNWKRVYIPDTKCGNGMQYSVYVEIKNPNKLAIEFMGGGACWSKNTCWGPNFRTVLFPLPKLPAMSVLSSGYEQMSPLSDYSFVYFPYCTGDVFAGDHTAKYEGLVLDFPVHHRGYTNVQKTIKYLKENKIDFSQVEDFVVYGSSAGAIGSLVHAKHFENELPRTAKKTLIADSPGLHFGKHFWKKFTPKILSDFHKAFKAVNFDIDFKDGLIAHQVPNYCATFSNWNIGIIQSTQDLIMSAVFGEISPEEHRNLVLGKEGLAETIKGIRNCSAFIPDSKMHTFYLLLNTANRKINNTSVLDYTENLLKGDMSTYIE